MQTELPQHLAAKVRYRTDEASTYLAAAFNVKIAPATLNKLRSVGGGPAFQKFLRSALYRREDLDEWACRKLGEPVASTSQRQ